jgi:S1-C subfamily serine protease
VWAYYGAEGKHARRAKEWVMRKDSKDRVLLAVIAVAVVFSFGAVLAQSPGEDDRHHRRVFVHEDSDEDGSRAWLGVGVEEETENPDGGARVTWVVPDSPAEEIGLRKGDIIVSVGGTQVYGPGGLTKRIRASEPGESVEIEIVRDGRHEALTVELGERQGHMRFLWSEGDEGSHSYTWSMEQFEEQMEGLEEKMGNLEFHMPKLEGRVRFLGHRPKLGVQLVDATPELREHLGGNAETGVLVGKVMRGMPAEAAGVEVGDLIESINGESIEDAGDLIEALAEAEDETITLGVVRDGRPMQIDVVIPDPEEQNRPTGPRA